MHKERFEQFYAKLKALLRKAAARTIEALIAAIADALITVTRFPVGTVF